MTHVERVWLSLVIGCASAAWPAGLARAQSAEAEALFRDGRAQIKRGELAAGCDKLAASEQLESSVGTLLNLGDCREKLGKLASAWAAFRKAEALASRAGGDDRRQAEARRRAAALEPRVAKLVIEVPHRTEGLVIRRDGELVDPARWSAALPVDPGRYTIRAEAPGHTPWRTTVVVEGETARQVVVVPGLARTRLDVSSARAAPLPALQDRRVVHAPRTGTWTATRVVSAVAVLAGAGALGTGAYFGVRSQDLRERADRGCPFAVCTDAEALRLNADAQTQASRANLLFLAGGATLATAVVLWLVGSPGEAAVIPAVSEREIGVSMARRF